MYDAATAAQEAFSLLTIPTKCPPDLMEYLINNHYIPDAQFPEFGEKGTGSKECGLYSPPFLIVLLQGRLDPPHRYFVHQRSTFNKVFHVL